LRANIRINSDKKINSDKLFVLQMVSIGDFKNNLKILQTEAKQMKYQDDFDLEGYVL
jgi:hypothetical protein